MYDLLETHKLDFHTHRQKNQERKTMYLLVMFLSSQNGTSSARLFRNQSVNNINSSTFNLGIGYNYNIRIITISNWNV